MFLLRTLAVSTVALSIVAGCGSQKDEDYNGEPLAQIHGDVQAASAAPPVDADVALAWTNFVGSPDVTQAVAATVRGSFPAKFEIDVFEPPPRASINDLRDEGVAGKERPFAVASIVALRTDNPTAPLGERLVGGSEDHVVVYLPQALEPNTLSAGFVGGALGAGFHMMRVVRHSAEEKQAIAACQDALPEGTNSTDRFLQCGSAKDQLVEEPTGFSTSIIVKLGDNVAYPNYY